MKRILLLTAIGAMLLAAACGGGDKPAASTADPAPGTDTERTSGQPANTGGEGEVLGAAAFLRQSSNKVEEVEGFRGTFEMTMKFGTESFVIDGDIAYEAPGGMYMSMQMTGVDIEVVAHVPDFYVRIPGEGWFSLDADSLGLDRSQFENYLDDRGPIDFDALLDGLEDVEELPTTYIDGARHSHYRGTFDIAGFIDELPAGTIEPEMLALIKDGFEPAPFEVWVNDDTGLPRRVKANIVFSIPNMGSMTMEMVMNYESYEGPFNIPAAPADARPFDPDLLGS